MGAKGMRVGDRCPMAGCNATITGKAGEPWEPWEDGEPAEATASGWRQKFQTWLCGRGHPVLEQLRG